MTQAPTAHFLARDHLDVLVQALRVDHTRVLGPTRRDGTITLDELGSADDLPAGWTLEQGPGRVRLKARDDQRAFGFSVGPESVKRQIFPAQEPLYSATKSPDGKLRFTASVPDPAPSAVLGVRACDLAAMDVQAKVFDNGTYREPRTSARRDALTLVAVQCTHPSELCFCLSTGTGPRVKGGASLIATELADGLVLRADDARGQALLASLPVVVASDTQLQEEQAALDAAEASMGRELEQRDLPAKLLGALESSAWEDVAERCLACGNCTSVCPTCFCSTTDVGSDLSGQQATHERRWESCFTSAHAEVHGGNFRPEVQHRYRQWLTHKLGTWHAQFGVGGCVGCGRCIAWCPVGIDLVEEAKRVTDGTEAAPAVVRPAPPSPKRELEDLCPRTAEVLAVRQDTADVWTLHLAAEPDRLPAPGQFYMLSLPGIGESALSVSAVDQATVAHTIRAVGAVTGALCALQPGDQLGVRGPYGQAWPVAEAKGRPLVLIAGGLGMAPLRPVLHAALDEPAAFPEVRVLYGARRPEDQLYPSELVQAAARDRVYVALSVDRAGPQHRGVVGPVTRLMTDAQLPLDGNYMVCGPEVMMHFVILRLRERGIAGERIWVSLERHMKCAAGFCGRCQLGPEFVCKDGPVFRYDRVAHLMGKEGL